MRTPRSRTGPLSAAWRSHAPAAQGVRLTANRRSWGFGLCFLYLRNVKGFKWNHKRVYRIYCELELNLRIKPKKRLKRPKPDELAVPDAPNQTWSMDFMADQLAPSRQNCVAIRLPVNGWAKLPNAERAGRLQS